MTRAVFVLWPNVAESWRRLETALAPEFIVERRRDIALAGGETGFAALLYDIYMRKHTALFPEHRQMFRDVIGAKAEALGGGAMRIRALRTRYTGYGDSGAATEQKKAALRALAPCAVRRPYRLNLNLHASDGPAEAAYLDDLLFNDVSLAHYAVRPAALPRADMLDRLHALRCLCLAKGVDVRRICAVSGSVLELCGLREASDLDVIADAETAAALGGPARLEGGVDIAPPDYHPTIPDADILRDGGNHFNVLGVKFAALPVVIEAKQAGRRAKDGKDAALLASPAARAALDTLAAQ